MKKLLLILSLLLSGVSVQAQQDALYSAYRFNPLALNPAYAGSRDAISIVALHRSQWVGIDGAPMTESLAIHSPIGKTKLAVGFNMAYDQLGPTNNLMGFLTLAYHLQLKKGRLSFGVKGGIYDAIFDFNDLDYKNPDPLENTGTVHSVVPSFDFGIYYYTNYFFIGAAVNHMTRHEFKFENVPTSNEQYLHRHYNLMVGGAIPVAPNVVLKPSLKAQYVYGAPFTFDINFSTLLYKKVWVGASYRYNNSIVFLTEWNITDYMRIGYAFDLAFNELIHYNKGTHEVFLGFDFNLKSKTIISPRYL